MFWESFFVAPSDSQEISMLLRAWGNGDQAALDRLTPLVYAELHRMARRHMRNERENSLQTTALVHEAYLRLVDAKGLACKDRAHFFALSAQVMPHSGGRCPFTRFRKARGRCQAARSLQGDQPGRDCWKYLTKKCRGSGAGSS